MDSFEQELGLPEEWLSADDEQKQRWTVEAGQIYAEHGNVPPNSVHSFAVAWDYFRRSKDRKFSKTISNYESRQSPEDAPAEAAG